MIIYQCRIADSQLIPYPSLVQFLSGDGNISNPSINGKNCRINGKKVWIPVGTSLLFIMCVHHHLYSTSARLPAQRRIGKTMLQQQIHKEPTITTTTTNTTRNTIIPVCHVFFLTGYLTCWFSWHTEKYK